MDSAQARYKRNFDELVCKARRTLQSNGYAFVREELFTKDAPKHKLAPIADGPY